MLNYEFVNCHPQTCRRTIVAKDERAQDFLKRHANRLGLLWFGDNLFLIKYRRDSESVQQLLDEAE